MLRSIINELGNEKTTVCIGDFNMEKELFTKKLSEENITFECSNITEGGSRSMCVLKQIK